jgi:hypothetical protein
MSNGNKNVSGKGKTSKNRPVHNDSAPNAPFKLPAPLPRQKLAGEKQNPPKTK